MILTSENKEMHKTMSRCSILFPLDLKQMCGNFLLTSLVVEFYEARSFCSIIMGTMPKY